MYQDIQRFDYLVDNTPFYPVIQHYLTLFIGFLLKLAFLPTFTPIALNSWRASFSITFRENTARIKTAVH